MIIKNLNCHCGICSLIEYCGDSFGFCICKDSRFSELEEIKYLRISENANPNEYAPCEECKNLNGCLDCEHCEESRDFYCNQIANYVEKEMEGEKKLD